jgi:hypothetical protein
VFQKLGDLYKSTDCNGCENKALKGESAKAWDARVLAEEQTLVQGMYGEMSPQAVRKWESGAKQQAPGSSLYLAVQGLGHVKPFPEDWSITNAQHRWAYGMQGMGHKAQPAEMAKAPVGADYSSGARYKALKFWAP